MFLLLKYINAKLSITHLEKQEIISFYICLHLSGLTQEYMALLGSFLHWHSFTSLKNIQEKTNFVRTIVRHH